MAARPDPRMTHDLFHLLLSTNDLAELLEGLSRRSHRTLASFGDYACGFVLRRRNRPAVVAGCTAAFGERLAERLESGDEHLARPLQHRRSSLVSPAPREWMADAGHALLAAPVASGPDGHAAFAVIGPRPPHPAEQRLLLSTVGRVRNESSWALRLAVRYTAELERADHRARAMQNRTVIDLAMGIIMAQSRCSADEAFDVLRRASNHRNVKLRDVAAELVQRIHPKPPATLFID
ncbi:ANTAR domain-containing protein [Sinomonas halotolerans]|uniref:ANTAR domain-containing protein n=1 Tax=Sinomonas halotolerans TaxID=1644133 RepID=A0ABU9X247_9MICC